MPISQLGSAVAGEGVVDGETDGLTDGDGVTVGVSDGDGDGDLTMHGGSPSRQDPALRTIRSMQHPSTPPGRLPHLAPPHTPHEARQHTVPKLRVAATPVEQSGSAVSGDGDADGVTDVVGGGVPDPDGVTDGDGDGETMTHGGNESSHADPDFRILLMQHFEAPPGLFAHMGPPHDPHDFGQHTSSPFREFRIPVSHSGSAVSGDGDAVVDSLGLTDGVAAGMHGAGAVRQDTPAFKILLIQQFLAPPS